MSYPRLSPLGGTPADVARAVNSLLGHMDAPSYSSLVDAADDAAAATAGVPVNGVYRNGSVLMVRIA